ncbi:MAG: hypothetical protein C4321_10535, partial [Chloroflexota bacterium]
MLLVVASVEPSFGGPAIVARHLAGALRAVGIQPVVAGAGTNASGLPPGSLALGRVGAFHGTPLPRRMGPLLAMVKQVDVVHVLGLRDPVGTAAALTAGRAGVPVLVEPTGMHRRRFRSRTLKAAFDRALGNRLLANAA